MNVTHLCEQILDMHDYRAQLYDYLKNRMYAVAPNLTVLVGEIIGARLISHAGKLTATANTDIFAVALVLSQFRGHRFGFSCQS